MKTNKYQTRVFGAIILVTLLLSLLFPTSTAFADDTIPPAEPSEVVDAPVEEEAPLDENVASGEETPAVEEQVEEEPAAGETATEEPVAEDTAAEAEPGMEDEPVLAQLPDGTDVIVLDAEGEVVPLVSQEAAAVIASSDPMWCPEGVEPIANTGGCTDSYPSMTALLAALTGTNQPTQNGTIWIEKTYDSSLAEPGGTTNILIDGSARQTWRDYSLTIQGGWDGPGTNTVSGTSLFSGDRFRIINWWNDVTVRDIVIDGGSGGPSLEIEIDTLSTNTNNVTLENVEVKNNSNSVGAYIDNDESTGSVTVNNSRFTNNGDNDDGLQIAAMGNVTLLNIIATGNKDEGVEINNTYSNASATVQVLGTNVFTGNLGDGLYIRSDGNITLNNITADGNNDDGADISNASSSTNATVTLTGTNSFSGNTSDGLVVVSKGAITLSNVSANNNVNDSGVVLDNDETGAIGGVTINGTNTFSGNDNSGLSIVSRGAVNLDNITADGNKTATGVSINNCIWSGGVCLGSGDVTLTGVLVFTNNGNNDDGLNIYTGGNVSMSDVIATGNLSDGVEINNTRSTTSSTVTIGGTNVFTGNTGTGLLIYSNGKVDLNNITAGTNSGSGVYVENQTSTTNAAVTFTGENDLVGNRSNGLYIRSKGAITLSNITANGSTNGSGAYLDNDEPDAVGSVTINGANYFNGNNNYGLLIDSRGAVSLTNIIADGNKTEDGVNIENCNMSSGVCLGSGDVTLTGTLQFTNNGNDGNDDGLYVNSGGNVTMADVLATGNRDEGVEISNTSSNANAFVQIDGTNIFTGNIGNGLIVTSKGAIMASNITANGSVNDSGARLNNDQTGAVGGVTVTGTNSFSGNYDYGLEIDSRGAVSLNNITADNNITLYGVDIYNAGTGASGDVTITGTNSFSGNDDFGLQIYSLGAVNLNNITADGNKTQDGVNIENCSWGGSSIGCRGNGDVTITGANSFSGNGNGAGDYGLNILSGNNVTLENVNANGNQDSGVYIDNTRSSSNASVTMNGVNDISNNLNDGLVVYSDGSIRLNEITANFNGTARDDNGAELDNDTGSGDVIITGYYNSFSNNAGPGLYISTRGNIELYFATITDNNTASGSLNGAQFTTPGTTSNSARIYCSIFGNNKGYGLDAWNFENSLTFVGLNSFYGNPSGDYRFNGTASFVDPDYLCEEPVFGCTEPNSINYDPAANTDDGSCIPIVLGCMDPTAFNYNPAANTEDNSCVPVVRGCMDPSHPAYNPQANTPTICKEDTPKVLSSFLIPVTGGQPVPISCETPMTKLQVFNGDFVTFTDLCGYDALLETVPGEGLPGALPSGAQYVSGLNVTLIQNGNAVAPLPDGTSMTVSFMIPAGMEGQTFTILYWDGSKWVEESVSVESGYVKTATSNPGTFVLVIK